ncbi:MAG: hypothetical protein Q8M86_11355 [Syntrophales bacterium]|nr:hypothetical protein [Syntrophales bacterium]MDP3098538.1 hypothetical protein [Syntrophales bacterium]
MSLKILFLFLLGLFSPLFPALAEESRERHITVYGAVMTDGALAETAVFTANLDREYRFATVAVGQKIGNLYQKIDFELEGQIAKHLSGQHHWEFNAVLVARWLSFPWNDTLKTSFAFGEGFSLASETPAFEEKYDGEKTNPLMNYLMLEFAFALPRHPRWSLVTRIHHRSGIYGLINGAQGASNAIGLGIRYHF